MFVTYLSVSLFLGLFMSYIWSSNGFLNTLIKVGFSLYSLWTAALLVGYLMPIIQAAVPTMRFL
jgi:hypothetical protein